MRKRAGVRFQVTWGDQSAPNPNGWGIASLQTCEASQFSRVKCDLVETHAASGALVSQHNIDTIFLVRMSLHKPSNQLVLE